MQEQMSQSGRAQHDARRDSIKQEPTRKIRSRMGSQDLPSNMIKSTSTNILTFIPYNIFHQLQSMANIYFILIAILQCIKQISVTDGKPTVLVPLTFVMITVMVKDAIQEFNRYRKDTKENTKLVQVLQPDNTWRNLTWQDLRVGHVIRLQQDQMVPCDALLIKTQVKDKCYLQTKSLDGQTNLKPRKGFTNDLKFKHMSQTQKKNVYLERMEITYSAPNAFLHHFTGFVEYKNETISVSIDNLILRSCFLRNVHEVICVCLYTGPQTKVVLNSTQFEVKTSKLMAQVNKMVIQIFIWQLVIALAAALLSTLIQNSYPALMAYIPMSKFWILTWSWWLMMTYFVPISLMVTMEMVKMFQGMIIQKDKRGYSQQYDCNISANNTSVNQNLGQIKYILSDKTGTLTKNQMSFKKLYFAGNSYGQTMTKSDQQYLKGKADSINNVSFYSKALQEKLGTSQFQNYLRVLYLCHQIIVQKDQAGKTIFNSGSPDEIALINFAKIYGRELIEQSDSRIRVAQTKSGDRILTFDKLAFLQFNSDRKRMSKIIRHENGTIQILTKGADSSVYQLLKVSNKQLAKTAQDVATDKFSTQGLRTLMLAKRTIPQEEFKKWNQKYQVASSTIHNRQQALQQCYNLIEIELEFVGITAIQDKLQDDVAQTIRTIKQAGIQFFILTGDKRQTAINIGRSCGMIGPNTIVEKIPDYSKRNQQKYHQQLRQLKKRKSSGDVVYTLDASRPIPPDLPLHQTICYRCTPVQKQNFVKFVKQHAQQLTLAIGDGANDVNMITQADVGVAVRGKEGSEAARVSDYVVGEFRFLAMLTLYYGREWYRKNSALVAYNFFKNWFHVSSVVVYGAYTYFSGVLIFDIYMYQLFNLVFAALPIIAFALFDYEYSLKQSLSPKYKKIYQPGMKNEQFNQNVYFKTIGRGFLYGFIALIVVFFVLQDNVLDQDGRTGYMTQSGSVLYFDIIIIINLRILVISNGFTPILMFAVLFSISAYWIVYWLYISTVSTELAVSFNQQWSTVPILMVHLIMIALFILPQYAYKKYKWYNDQYKRNPMTMIARTFNYLQEKRQTQ